jgi:purine-nucleoside phosphorylase
LSLHLGAKTGDIAPIVFITGDPLRAKYYAETYLENPTCYNQIRGMFGFTGTFQGTRVSIQGTGIGIPSTALYVHELTHSYDVSCIIRVGTCGALQADLALGDLVAATHAFTDSEAVSRFLSGSDPSPADPGLLHMAEQSARELGMSLRKGPLFSTDLFYSEDDKRYDRSRTQGVLGVDMETSMLYAMGTWYGFKALSILTVSDNLLTGAESSAEEREKQTSDMMRVALGIVVKDWVSED